MGDIHVPADYNGLFAVEREEVVPEIVLPAHAVIEPSQPVLRVWRIDANEIKLLVFKADDAPLGVMLGDAHIVAYAQGLVLCKNRRAGVALFLGVAPVALVAVKLQVNLPGLELRLLKAEKSASRPANTVSKPFLTTARRPLTFHEINLMWHFLHYPEHSRHSPPRP